MADIAVKTRYKNANSHTILEHFGSFFGHKCANSMRNFME
jgi:hypothetical protein